MLTKHRDKYLISKKWSYLYTNLRRYLNSAKLIIAFLQSTQNKLELTITLLFNGYAALNKK
jgi:hypothetical protein